jgi:hypothetical protein
MPVIDDYNHPYYYTLKAHARGTIVNSLNNKINRVGGRENWSAVTLCSVNGEAIDFARTEWPKHYGPTTHNGFTVSWERLLHKFAQRPSYYDLAIWQVVDSVKLLQGLALGQPSNGKTHMVINWVERSFASSYLKGGILLPILACAEEYAKLLGCERVLIKDAVDRAKYERYGYSDYKLAKVRANYLAKEL